MTVTVTMTMRVTVTVTVTATVNEEKMLIRKVPFVFRSRDVF